MVKVKLLSAEDIETLENLANLWLAAHNTLDIIDIQYRVREHAWCNYSVCITYCDTSKED